ncbi:MAG: hypothetical protein GY882_04240, partial [Actinomycetia bacterium]|nr:hypothetical protein [Actinomycetes bacterium]
MRMHPHRAEPTEDIDGIETRKVPKTAQSESTEQVDQLRVDFGECLQPPDGKWRAERLGDARGNDDRFPATDGETGGHTRREPPVGNTDTH